MLVGDMGAALGHPEYTAVKPQLPVKLGGLYTTLGMLKEINLQLMGCGYISL